jgi:hypothetical protein
MALADLRIPYAGPDRRGEALNSRIFRDRRAIVSHWELGGLVRSAPRGRADDGLRTLRRRGLDPRPNYFDFVRKLVLAIGVAFVLPAFLVILNFAGVISARSIIMSWRIACLVIVLFTAIATPAADVVSMFLLAIPMLLLYFAAYAIADLHDRRVAL